MFKEIKKNLTPCIMFIWPNAGNSTINFLQCSSAEFRQAQSGAYDSRCCVKLSLWFEVHKAWIFNWIYFCFGWYSLHNPSKQITAISSRFRFTTFNLSSPTVLYFAIYLRRPVKSTRTSENTLYFFKLQTEVAPNLW